MIKSVDGASCKTYICVMAQMTPYNKSAYIKAETMLIKAITTSRLVNPQAPAAFGTLKILLTTASFGLTSLALNQGTRHLLVGDVDTSSEYAMADPHSVLHSTRLSLYI